MCAAASDASPNNSPRRDHTLGEDLAETGAANQPENFPERQGTNHTSGGPEAAENTDARSPLARRMIRGYQEYLSGLKMGPTCRFEPTCSNYALTAFGRYGPIKGFLLSAARLGRCGPWHPGGWDPVPPRRSRRAKTVPGFIGSKRRQP